MHMSLIETFVVSYRYIAVPITEFVHKKKENMDKEKGTVSLKHWPPASSVRIVFAE